MSDLEIDNTIKKDFRERLLKELHDEQKEEVEVDQEECCGRQYPCCGDPKVDERHTERRSSRLLELEMQRLKEHPPEQLPLVQMLMEQNMKLTQMILDICGRLRPPSSSAPPPASQSSPGSRRR